MSCSKYYSIIHFTIRHRRWPLGALVFLAVVSLLVLDFVKWDLTGINKIWTDKLSTVTSIATLGVALAVWCGELYQDWRAALPCKLTAVFLFKNKEVMRCDLADLSSESDMRALGQQIGRHMHNGKDLKIKIPALHRTGGEPEVGLEGEIYRHWTIQFTLLERPETVPEGKVLRWVPPFDKTPEQSLCDS